MKPQLLQLSAFLNPVYTIQPVVKPVVKRVLQPVECLCTRYNRLSIRFDNDNRFDNRLHRVSGALNLFYAEM